MAKTIVILGVGLSGAVLIRQIMRTVVLPSEDYKMIVIAPNTHFHWSIGMPRAIVPGQFSDDQVMYDLVPVFKQYPEAKFEFVQATATGLDPEGKVVNCTLNDGSKRDVSYGTLVIGTGSQSSDDMPWKALGPTEHTKSKLHHIQESIKDAETIVIAGGGYTGVETAGELGYEYSRTGRKKVIFVHPDTLPFGDAIKSSVRKQVKTELEKMKVKIIPEAKVTDVQHGGKDTVIEVTKADGAKETITAQAYLPAIGLKPNTDFAPSSWLDGSHRIKQTKTLQVEGYPDVFVMGDAGNLQLAMAQTAENQAKHLITALPKYLKGEKAPEYTPNSVAYGITLGRSRATGQVNGFKLLSFMVWWFKGRTMGTEVVPAYAQGTKTLSGVYEK